MLLPAFTNAGGGVEAAAAYDHSGVAFTNLTYGSDFAYPLGEYGGESGIKLDTFNNNNRYVDISVENNTGNDITVDKIHFDIAQIFGSVGATVRVSHFGNAGNGITDLDDDWGFRSLMNSTLADGDFGWNEFDVSTAAMADTTLANGEAAAFRIFIDDNGANPEMGLKVDNIAISTVTITVADYATWIASFGLSGSPDADPDHDYDGDGWDNLMEYGLDGTPNGGTTFDGVVPSFGLVGGALEYIHLQRNDDTNLVYYLELTDDLVFGPWTNSGYTITGTDTSLGGDFDEVTNSIPTTNAQQFIRLIIEQ